MTPRSRPPGRRLAIISQGLGGIEPPHAFGSMATWSYETSRHLAERWSVLLIEFGKQAFETRRLEYGGCAYVYIPTAVNRVINAVHKRLRRAARIVNNSLRSSLRPDYASVFNNLGYIVQAAWRARRWGCDVVHIHNFSQFVPTVRALNPSARIVLHMNCEWLSQHDRSMIARRVNKADAIACCSDHVRRQFVAVFPEFQAKSHVVYNGTNVDRFVPSRNVSPTGPGQQLRVLFVGRISPEKGVHVLVDAFAKVAASMPNVSLELVGGAGSLPPEFLAGLSRDPLVRSLERFYRTDYLSDIKGRIPQELRGRITFHGSLNHEQLVGHYGSATVFACPSFSDAFPLTVVEAMAAGLPVVASSVGGIPESVVDGETGLLVPPDDTGALAAAMTTLLTDGALRCRLADAGRARALAHFSWKAISEQASRVYAGDTSVQGAPAEALTP